MPTERQRFPSLQEPDQASGFSLGLSAHRRKRLTPPVVSLIAFATALNLSVGQIAAALKLPLYLDMIGTVLCAALAGFRPGAYAAVASNILASPLGSPTMIFFAPVGVVVAACSAGLSRVGTFRHFWSAVAGGALQGVIAASASAPIAAFVFGGVTLAGTDLLVALYRGAGFSLLQSTWLQGLTSDIPDKIVTFVLVAFVVHGLPSRLSQRFRAT